MIVPHGWLGQDYGVSARTSRLLAEAGFTYTLDWPNDEQPYWHNPDRSLIAVPSQPDWDDVQTLLLRRVPVHRFHSLVSDALERLVVEERQRARLWTRRSSLDDRGTAPHPLLQEAFRSRASRASGVLPASAGQIAQWFKEGQDRMKLSDAANVLRSKNAGPLALTIDILFPAATLRPGGRLAQRSDPHRRSPGSTDCQTIKWR